MDDINSCQAPGIIYPKHSDITISISECNTRKNSMKEYMKNTKITASIIVSKIFNYASRYNSAPQDQFEEIENGLRNWLSVFICWKVLMNRDLEKYPEKMSAENANRVFLALLKKLWDDYYLNVDFVFDSDVNSDSE